MTEVKEEVQEVQVKEEGKSRKETEKEMMEIRKKAQADLIHYKKRLKESNDLKELQVRELELNIAYYKNKKEWLDLQGEVEKLEKREMEAIRNERERMRREAEAQTKSDESKKIIISKMGKPREKEQSK